MAWDWIFFCCFHVYRSYVSLINEDVIQLDSDEDDRDAGDPLEISKGNETATRCTEFYNISSILSPHWYV